MSPVKTAETNKRQTLLPPSSSVILILTYGTKHLGRIRTAHPRLGALTQVKHYRYRLIDFMIELLCTQYSNYLLSLQLCVRFCKKYIMYVIAIDVVANNLE